MIFVTIGTSEPFDRLLRVLDELPLDEELVVQCGRSSVRPRHALCFDFLPYEGLLERIQTARIVVMHAGVGSVLAALTNGKRPIVVPRLHCFGEAVDDHQVVFGRRLQEAGLVNCVEDPKRLPRTLTTVPNLPVAVAGADARLVSELREYLGETIHRQRRRVSNGRW